MSELGRHIGPLVEKETNVRNILRKALGAISVIWHGLLPHKQPKEAEKKITKYYFPEKDEDDTYYSTSMEMYRESKDRIQHLEEKAFKLLTYISAVSAILFFFLSAELKGIINIIVISSIALLVVAMVISLRCIGAKVQKALFIDTIIDFDGSKAIRPKSKSEITAEIVNCTVYNQTVADNTADILKASSYILSVGILTTVVAFVVFFSINDATETQMEQIGITFSDSTFEEVVKNNLILNNEKLDNVNDLLNKIEALEAAKKIQLDTLSALLEKVHLSADKKHTVADP